MGTTGAEDAICNPLSTNTQNCVVDGTACKLENKDCAEITTGAEDAICNPLSTDTQNCVVDGTACKLVNKFCEEITTGAENAICNPLSTDTQNCVVDGTACKLVNKFCEEITNGASKKICQSASTKSDGTGCIFNGEKCQATNLCDTITPTNKDECENAPTSNNIISKCIYKDNEHPCQIEQKVCSIIYFNMI